MADVKSQVLGAAKQLYTSEGYAGLSMRKVAKLAGVSTMASYRYFDSKEHLLHVLQVHAIARYRDGYLAPLMDIGDPWQALRQAMSAYGTFALEETEYFKIVFLSTDQVASLRSLTPEGEALFDDVFARSRQFTAAVVGDECATQETMRIWAFMHGIVALHLAGRLEFLQIDFLPYYETEVDNYHCNLRHRFA